MTGKIKKISYNSFGWNSGRIIVIPTSQGEVDVHIPKDKFIGDNGNMLYTVTLNGNTIVIESEEDYTIGRFPNSRRTTPEKTIIFLAQKTENGTWKIKENHLPAGSVKPTPQTYWDRFGRWEYGFLECQ